MRFVGSFSPLKTPFWIVRFEISLPGPRTGTLLFAHLPGLHPEMQICLQPSSLAEQALAGHSRPAVRVCIVRAVSKRDLLKVAVADYIG